MKPWPSSGTPWPADRREVPAKSRRLWSVSVPEAAPHLEFRDYLRVLRRRRWVLLVTAFLITAAAVTASLLQTPVYQASTRALVTAKRLLELQPDVLRSHNGRIE